MLGLTANDYVQRACGARPKSAPERASLRARLEREWTAEPTLSHTVALFALGRADLAMHVARSPENVGVLHFAILDLLPIPRALAVRGWDHVIGWIEANAGDLSWDPCRDRYVITSASRTSGCRSPGRA